MTMTPGMKMTGVENNNSSARVNMKEIINEVFNRFGTDILLDGDRFLAIITDMAPNSKTELQVLRRLKQDNLLIVIHDEIIKSKPNGKKIKVFLTNNGYSTDWIEVVFSTFGLEYSLDTQQTPKSTRPYDNGAGHYLSYSIKILFVFLICFSILHITLTINRYILNSRSVEETTVSKDFDNLSRDDAVDSQNSIDGQEDNSSESQESTHISSHTEPPICMSAIIQVYSSSSLAEYGMVHSPDRLIDGDVTKGWAEGVAGIGSGEWVRFDFDGKYKISGITISQGFQESRDMFIKNARPSHLKIICDGHSEDLYLKDEMSPQTFPLNKVAYSDYIIIKIIDAYKGTKYDDTVISEILLF